MNGSGNEKPPVREHQAAGGGSGNAYAPSIPQPPAILQAPKNRIQEVRAYCHSRGWSDDVIDRFGIGPNHGAGIEYNCAGGRKVKTFDSEPKYFWCEGCPPTGDYYHAGRWADLARAIDQAGGVLLQGAGDADLWTLVAAGAANAVSFAHGEKPPPATFAHDLTLLGVAVVRYWPDRDESGVRHAAAIRDALAGSDIRLDVRLLPGTLGSAYDLNALWKRLQFSAAAFWDILDSLPALRLSDPAPAVIHPPAPPLAATGDYNGAYAAKWQQVRPAVEQALGYTGKRAIRCPNPDHEDHVPSASYDPERGNVRCWVCCPDGHWNARQLCELTGVPWPVDEHPQRPRPALPNAVREALAKLKSISGVTGAQFGRVTEALCAAFDPGRRFTVGEARADLDAAGVRVAKKTLYAVLSHPIFSPKCPCNIESGEGAGQKGEKFNITDDDEFAGASAPARRVAASASGKRGRPATVYVMPSPAALCEAFGVKDCGGDVLSTDVLTSKSEWRAALHEALIARRPGPYTRRWLGGRLGVSGRTTQRYEQARPQIAVTPRVGSKPVTEADAARLADDLETADKIPNTWLEIGGARRAPYRETARAALESGEAVMLCWRKTNYYSIGDGDHAGGS